MTRHSSDSSCLRTWATLQVEGAPLLYYGLLKGDNFGYFVQTAPHEVIAIDSPHGEKMLSILRERGWTLKALLLTHGHHDHVVDLETLLVETGCTFYKAKGAPHLPEGIELVDGERFEVEGLSCEVLETSGHSPLDLSYYFPDLELCFCGDSLFHNGCGRMFAGPASRFWASLLRLRGLPDETQLCCGHDYAADNARFCRQWFPGSRFGAEDEAFPHGPMLLGEQKQQNPFLCADQLEVAQALGMEDAEASEVFKKLRELRNQL